MGDLTAGHAALARAVALREATIKSGKPNANNLRGLAQALTSLGDVLGSPLDLNLGETEKALDAYRRARDILQSLTSTDPSNAQPARDLAYAYFNLSAVSLESNPAEAASYGRQALKISERLTQNEPNNLDLRRDLAWGNFLLGAAAAQQGRIREGLILLKQALSIQESLLKVEKSRMLVRYEYTLTLQWIGDWQMAARDRPAALATYRNALEMAGAAAAEQPSNLRARATLADVYQRLGGYYASTGDTQQANSWYQKSLDIWNTWTRDAAPSPYQAKKRDLVSRSLANLAGSAASATAR
jgi:tetratricopeptide (TPR) repeat protein